MIWRRALMAISLPFATICATFLFWSAAELSAIDMHDVASIQFSLAFCMVAWAAVAIFWLIWNPSQQEWLGESADE